MLMSKSTYKCRKQILRSNQKSAFFFFFLFFVGGCLFVVFSYFFCLFGFFLGNFTIKEFIQIKPNYLFVFHKTFKK